MKWVEEGKEEVDYEHLYMCGFVKKLSCRCLPEMDKLISKIWFQKSSKNIQTAVQIKNQPHDFIFDEIWLIILCYGHNK